MFNLKAYNFDSTNFLILTLGLKNCSKLQQTPRLSQEGDTFDFPINIKGKPGEVK